MPPLTKGRAVYGDDADYPDTGVGASPLLATTESIGEDLSRNNAFRQENGQPCVVFRNRNFTGRGMCMMRSIEFGDKGEKDFGYAAGVLSLIKKSGYSHRFTKEHFL